MLTLDDLKSDWLAPEREQDFSLPAITNHRGVVQAAWSVSGVQNWIAPPTGMSTPTALLYQREGDRIRRCATRAEHRWRAYEIERRAAGVSSALRMAPDVDGIVERLTFERAGRYYLVFLGLPRVWRFTDYWNLPPEDVPMLNLRATPRGFELADTKTFGRAEFVVPGRLTVHIDLQGWLDGEPACEQGRVGVAELDVRSGERVTWWAVQGCEEQLPTLEPEAAWSAAERHWRDLWQAAFTPGNTLFSGHLPRFEGPLERLYLMSVLSLLSCWRRLPKPTRRSQIATGGQCIWNSAGGAPLDRATVWGGPEGAPTTLFLWELEFQAPLLARLDPLLLRRLLEVLLAVDLERHWGIETLSGCGAGMGYGVNPGAFLSCVSDYVRLTGDRRWALERETELRRLCRPGLTDYGGYENVLECVSTYEHQVAAFNALNVQGMRFVAELTGDGSLARAADELAREVLALYAGGPFACRQPDGSRRVVRTVLDFVYVGRALGGDLPADVRRGMLAFFERELQTHDWLRALSPQDPDALTRRLPSFQTFRADHQATGSYDGWPARAASVLLRFGEREKALAWLARIQELSREGPFGQAHLVHADGRARKASFHNGNCYFESAGCGFATTLLEDL